MTGYQYDRSDVTARGLANWYAQILGQFFTESNKPCEVELVVAEVGETPEADQIYRITFDGSVAEEHGFVAMGGQADQVASGAQGPLRRWPAAGPGAGRGHCRAVQPGQRRRDGPDRPAAGGGHLGPGPGAPDVPAADRSRLGALLAEAGPGQTGAAGGQGELAAGGDAEPGTSASPDGGTDQAS